MKICKIVFFLGHLYNDNGIATLKATNKLSKKGTADISCFQPRGPIILRPINSWNKQTNYLTRLQIPVYRLKPPA